jgi:RHS repeat-associated protein
MGCLKLTYETEFCLSLAGAHKQTLGRRKKRAGTYKYKYNGKELQDELGLNWLDYGWRNYDPAISRWVNPDPLLNDLDFAFDDSKVDEDDDDEVYQALITKLDTGGGIYNPDNLNPYGYGYNNPVSFDDPDGRCPICPIIAIAVMLLASEPAMAPTHDKAGDAKKMGEAKTAKFEFMTNAIPGAGLRNATAGTALKVVVKNEVKNKVKEQVKKTAEKVAKKETGSYTNTHESGKKYHGKGDETRMTKSANEKAKANNDPVKTKEFTKAKNDREAYKQESKRLQNDGGHKNPNNYNKRDSPGTNYRKQDGEN